MRILLSGLIAAGLLSSQYAAAAGNSRCAKPAEAEAFELAELKSELMVTALTCQTQDKYNTFITQYRKDLMAQEKALKAYFARAYGKRGQAEHDNFITSLANSESHQGLSKGNLFCDDRVPMFDEVLAIHGPGDLPDYVRGKDLAVPATFEVCPAEEPSRRARPTVRRVSSQSAHHAHH